MSPAQESFYLFESDSKSKVTATSALAATCLVVKIKSTTVPGTQYGYYRIDFKDYTTGAYLDLLRNHDYRIEVESIEGAPAQTADEAYKGNHTLKCKIVPWNQVNEEVVVPGNKRLSVDKRVFQFPGDPNVAGETGGTQTLTLSTENTGGWRIDGKPDWVNLSQTSGADGTPATVTLSVVGVNPGRTDRTAVMNLVAGNLTYKIHLSQPDACGKNGVPKKMRIGNNDYYTHRFGGQCWMLENSREGTPDRILPALPGRPHQRYLWNGFSFASPEKIGLPAGWAGPTYTDVYNLRADTYPDGTGSGIGTTKWLWLQWQKDPGVVSYHPTFDGNGPLVEPSSYWASIGGRTPDKFWPGDYHEWEYRRLPRLLSYIQKQQDDISAFWSHQWITDINWHSGVQTIPAADGKEAHAYMARMPIVTVNVGIPNPSRCCIQIATTLREPGTHISAVDRAEEWLTNHWWVNPATGENWSHGYDGLWEKGKLRKASGHAGWFGPDDMPWRVDPSRFYTLMLAGDRATYANLFTGGGYYYKTRKSSSYPFMYEKDFYPGANELSTYSSTGLPNTYYWLDFVTQTGLGAYLENLLPVRFVRRD
ncbi:BACON domain-containing protein [Bacteroides sp. 272]|uniref:BACON domain-containing protein n=2 Tax=unclassified Bacteroides TaxID=2646097 RepID=UPI0040638F21